MRVLAKEVMTTPVVTIEASASGYDAAQSMEQHGIQHLVVLGRKRELLGVISDRDVREAQPSTLVVKNREMRNKALSVMRVSDLMATEPVTVDETAPIEDVLRAMHRLKVGCVPIVAANKVVGIVTGSDVVELALRLLSAEV